ncbi:hypothetical protein CORC01_01661 [Colletotrichum orchidophilum]|uniref:F-box domain-containing protein n=1 Tax=Colletotrichum orchidophilum TaxID=1209926 RepID=A0A1G4BNM3_9PEZI|nr:uncharacterized protein CORC01_01661 [Colletotrichum orchidophilum]OHF02903.1 hypothetical protein CORC01_01661 [Colletotrichum orchidophilum]
MASNTSNTLEFTAPEIALASHHPITILDYHPPSRSSHLPDEILLRIASGLNKQYESSEITEWQSWVASMARRNLSKVCLVGPAWRRVGQQLLYRNYRSSKTLPLFLRTLIECPGLGKHVESVSLNNLPSSRGYRKEEATLFETRSKELGMYFPRRDAYRMDPQMPPDQELQSFLAAMLLSHTPRVKHVKLQVHWPHSILTSLVASAKSLALTPPRRSWTGLDNLAHIALGVMKTKAKSHLLIYDANDIFRTLQVAPNMTSIALFNYAPIKSSTKPCLEKLFRNLTTLKIGGKVEGMLLKNLETFCKYGKAIEEIHILAPESTRVGHVLVALEPLAATLKRLRLSLGCDYNCPTWGRNGPDLLQRFTSLETLRLELARSRNDNRCWYEELRTRDFFESLPTSLRTLFLSGCNWEHEIDYRGRRQYDGISTLASQVFRGALPEFQTLHFACDCVKGPQSEFTEIEKLGVKVVEFRHQFQEQGSDLAGLDVENWKLH